MTAFLYKWLPIVFGCHCKDERSFIYHRRKFPICARCTGELVGMIGAIIGVFFVRLSWNTLIFLLIPMIIDGVVQLCTSYISTNFRRFITGLLFGYAGMSLFIESTIYVFLYF